MFLEQWLTPELTQILVFRDRSKKNTELEITDWFSAISKFFLFPFSIEKIVKINNSFNKHKRNILFYFQTSKKNIFQKFSNNFAQFIVLNITLFKLYEPKLSITTDIYYCRITSSFNNLKKLVLEKLQLLSQTKINRTILLTGILIVLRWLKLLREIRSKFFVIQKNAKTFLTLYLFIPSVFYSNVYWIYSKSIKN